MASDPAFAPACPPQYYAVIFASRRTPGDHGYTAMAERMAALAATQPGYLGIESVRGSDGFGITVSYWDSLAAISAWKKHLEHQSAQEAGKRAWYADYQVRISQVQRAYAKDGHA